MVRLMNIAPTSQAPAGAPSNDPAADRAAACAEILGETETERAERHIRTLRRLTELALNAAERLDRQAEAQAAETQPAAGAEQPDDALSPDEVALALHRLSRLARLNIALEQKLI